MNNMNILKTGVDLASHLLGKEVGHEVEYYNDYVENGRIIKCNKDCHSDYDSDEAAESPMRHGRLGHIYIGHSGSKITLGDIFAALDELIENDYHVNSAITSVSYNEQQRRITL